MQDRWAGGFCRLQKGRWVVSTPVVPGCVPRLLPYYHAAKSGSAGSKAASTSLEFSLI